MKTTSFILTSLLFAVLFGFTSCDNNDCISGTGNIVTREIDLAGFHSITSSGSMLITIEQADEQRVEVVSHQNIIDRLERDVIDSIWDIELEDNRCYKNTDITVRIYIPEIRMIETSGSIEVVLNTFNDLNNLDIECSGSARIFQSGILDIANRFSLDGSGSTEMVANFNAQHSDIDISGSADIKLQGSSTFQDINISGSAEIDAFDFVSDTCEVDISGSGDLDLHVNDYLDVDISGSGTIRYLGNPTIMSNISGSGNIIDAN
jgi:hypothetical protein